MKKLSLLMIAITFNANALTENQIKKIKSLRDSNKYELVDISISQLLMENQSEEEKTALYTIKAQNYLKLAKKYMNKANFSAKKTKIEMDIKATTINKEIIKNTIEKTNNTYKEMNK